MKIFNRELADYEKEPKIKTIDEDALDVDKPFNFLTIPNSNNLMMEGYLTVDGEEIELNYIDMHFAIRSLNLASERKFRLPYVEEMMTMYNRDDSSFRESLADKTKESIVNKKEWLNEVLHYKTKPPGPMIYRDPIRIRKVEGGCHIECEIGKSLITRAPKPIGFVKKIGVWGYPTVFRDPRDLPLEADIFWSIKPDVKEPVVRDWLAGNDCMYFHTDKPGERRLARLVEVIS